MAPVSVYRMVRTCVAVRAFHGRNLAVRSCYEKVDDSNSTYHYCIWDVATISCY